MTENKKYQIIYADPPWELLAGSPNLHMPHQLSRPLKYPTLSTSEIKNLPVKSIVDKNAVLFLWVTNKYIEQSYGISKAWGFNPTTMLVWCKEPKGRGLGGTFGLSTEYVLFGRRGNLKAKQRWLSTWFKAQRHSHSEKPQLMADIIEMLFEGNKIELFARRKRMGWDCWGNEVESDIEL